uniref:BTB domain-containing protein n=1 Tax=Ascaris lumbricoides TaxID=6252 RepID=A0A0M3I784_ASCLU
LLQRPFETFTRLSISSLRHSISPYSWRRSTNHSFTYINWAFHDVKQSFEQLLRFCFSGTVGEAKKCTALLLLNEPNTHFYNIAKAQFNITIIGASLSQLKKEHGNREFLLRITNDYLKGLIEIGTSDKRMTAKKFRLQNEGVS